MKDRLRSQDFFPARDPGILSSDFYSGKAGFIL